MDTYPERLPALLNIGVHAAQSRFEYILCKGLVDEFGDAGLSIELYVIQDAIEALAQADCEHGCDSSTLIDTSILWLGRAIPEGSA